MALQLAGMIVDANLAACVNIVPGLTSIYRWQGKREQGTEELLMIKTTTDCFPALQALVIE